MGLDVAQEGPRPCDNFRPPSTGWKAVGDGDSVRAARPGSWGPQEARVQASLTSHLLPLLTLTVETKENVSKGKFLALFFFSLTQKGLIWRRERKRKTAKRTRGFGPLQEAPRLCSKGRSGPSTGAGASGTGRCTRSASVSRVPAP